MTAIINGTTHQWVFSNPVVRLGIGVCPGDSAGCYDYQICSGDDSIPITLPSCVAVGTPSLFFNCGGLTTPSTVTFWLPITSEAGDYIDCDCETELVLTPLSLSASFLVVGTPFPATKSVTLCGGAVSAEITIELLAEPICRNYPCRSLFAGWDGGCTWISDPEAAELPKKWVLAVQSPTTATLTGYAKDGETITYQSDAWNCYERSQFKLTSEYGIFLGLPRWVCVAPITPPDAGEDCSEVTCDDGADVVPLTVGPINNLCGDIITGGGVFDFARGVVPEGLEGFDGLECGVLYREFDYTPSSPCDEFLPKVGVLVLVQSQANPGGCPTTIEYPDGSSAECGDPPSDPAYNRRVDTYYICFDGEGVPFVSLQECCGFYRCCVDPLPGVPGATLACCCEGVSTDCCPDDLIPTTLTLSDGTNSIELTYNPDNIPPSWDGIGGLLGCPSDTPAIFFCEGGTSWLLAYNGAGHDNIGLESFVSCDPFYVKINVNQSASCDAGYTYFEVTL